MSISSRPYLYLRITLGIVAVSFGAIFVRSASDAPPLAIAAWRLGLASVLLGPLVLLRATRPFPRMRKKDLVYSVGSGVALALHFILWITSLRYTSVSSSVLFVTTHPIFVAVGSHFVLKERVGRRLAVGIALAVLGGAVIGIGDLRIGGDALHGDLLALGGGLAAAVYFLIGRRVRRSASLIHYVAVTYGTAAVVVLMACAVARCPLVGFSSMTYLFLVLLALVPQLIGHSTFNWALKHLPASKISVMILGEPIGAAILAMLFFNEVPRWLNGIGAVTILIGIYLTLHGEEEPNGTDEGSDEDRLGGGSHASPRWSARGVR
jgi:drug/metabolite transporter (DMT)-like permease